MVVFIMKIGERIKSLRNQREWSLRELEKRTGINYSVLSRIESGKRPLTDDEINIFSDLFDVNSDYLLGRSDTINENKTPKPKSSGAAYMGGGADWTEEEKELARATVAAFRKKQREIEKRLNKKDD